MNKIIVRSFLILLGFLAVELHVHGQELTEDKNKEIFLSFDEAIKPVNTRLYSGAEYIEKHRMVNDRHKFFQARDFIPGAVLYHGQPFYEVPLQYNIFEDIVIVNLQSEMGITSFRLFENKLQAFEVNGHKFVNISSPGAAINGIHELLFRDENFQVLKKHRVKEKRVKKNAYVHFEFRPRDPKYFFFYEGTYRELNRRRLLDAFPDQRSVIVNQFRNFRKQSSERKDQAAVVLFQTLSQSK